MIHNEYDAEQELNILEDTPSKVRQLETITLCAIRDHHQTIVNAMQEQIDKLQQIEANETFNREEARAKAFLASLEKKR